MGHNLKFKVKYKKYLKKIIQIIEVLFLIRSELKLYFFLYFNMFFKHSGIFPKSRLERDFNGIFGTLAQEKCLKLI